MAPHNSTFQRRTIRRHCLIPILKKKLGDLISCVTVRFFYLVLDEYNLHENKNHEIRYLISWASLPYMLLVHSILIF